MLFNKKIQHYKIPILNICNQQDKLVVKFSNHYSNKILCSSLTTLLNFVLFYFNEHKCSCEIRLLDGLCTVVISKIENCKNSKLFTKILCFILVNNDVYKLTIVGL